MINEETRRKLRELNLEEMIANLDIQSADTRYSSLSFEERIKMMVDYVYQEKYTSKVKRLIKGARFRIPSADVHEIYYVDRHLDGEQLLELSNCQFVSDARNIVFRGFTGSGKSYLACALGREACKKRYSYPLHPSPRPPHGVGESQDTTARRSQAAEEVQQLHAADS